MADVKWIKIVTDIFDDEKIMLIESLPDADSIIVIWFKLLCLAGKTNNSGVFLMSDRIPYTEEMFATIFRRNINTIRLALTTFEQFGMIEIVDGVVTIPNWGKHQTLDQMEERNEYMRKYMQEYRNKQKARIECKANSKVNSKVNSKLNGKVNSKVNVNSLEEDIEEEREVEGEEEYIDVSSLRSDTLSDRKPDLEEVVRLWNTLEGYGDIKPIKGIGESERKRLTIARLKQYGIDGFESAIEKIKNSDFLQGKNKNGWCIRFDWFVKPNNFPKVLEGNYDNKSGNGGDWWKGGLIDDN